MHTALEILDLLAVVGGCWYLRRLIIARTAFAAIVRTMVVAPEHRVCAKCHLTVARYDENDVCPNCGGDS